MENQRKKKVKNKSYEILNEVLISWNDSSSGDSGSIIQLDQVKEKFYDNSLDYFLNTFYFDGKFEMWNPCGWVFLWNNQISVILTYGTQDFTQWHSYDFDQEYQYALILGDIYTWHMKNVGEVIDWNLEHIKKQTLWDRNTDHDLPWIVVSSNIKELKDIIHSIKDDRYFIEYSYKGKAKMEFFEYDKMVKTKKELKVPVSLEYI